MDSFADTFKPVDINEEVDRFGRSVDVIGDSVDALDETQTPKAEVKIEEKEVVEPTSSFSSRFRPVSSSEEISEPTSSFSSRFRPVTESIPPELIEAGQEEVYQPSEKGVQYSGFLETDKVLKDYDKGSLTKERALKDPRVTALMRTGLEFRFGDRGILRRAAGSASSGISTNYKKDMSDEQVYEMWQNWQRSFHGGQTSTLAAETVFLAGLKDEEKGFAGSQYLLFDKSPNIFSEDVNWSETFDGIWDYSRAAVWDSTTLMSAGVGRLFSIGGAKATATAVRTTATAAFRASLKKGSTREAARKVAKQTAKKSLASITAKEVAKYSAVDFVANISADVLHQNLMMDVGVQKEYSATQTGVSALATILLPGVIASSKGFSKFAKSSLAPKFMKPAVDISDKFKGQTKSIIDKQMRARIDFDLVNSQFTETIENFSKNRGLYQKWSDAIVDSKDILGSKGVSLSVNEKVFMRGFLFGPSDGSQKGFVQTMEEAGLIYLQRDETDTISNFIGDAISWLPDKQVKDYVDVFVKNFGDFPVTPIDVKRKRISKLSKIESPEELAAFWRSRQSEVGARLWDSSEIKRRLGRKGKKLGPAGEGEATATELIDSMLIEPSEKIPDKKVGAYINSMWKSTLTATPATTGANLRGWGLYTGLNTMSDVVNGALNISLSQAQKAVGATDSAKVTMQIGKASVLGSMRRGVGFLSMGDTLESSKALLEVLGPKVSNALSRDMGGDSGAKAGKDTIKLFGLNPDSSVLKKSEEVRKFLQTVSGVKMQDELTKQINFMTNVEQYTLHFYGKSYNDFIDDPALGFIELKSPKFHNTVVKNALHRTLSETGNLPMVGKEGSNIPLMVAKAIEKSSQNAIGGYLIPFGKFFNTATAAIGDYSALNLFRYTINRTPTGLIAEDRTTLLSKAAVAWVGIYLLKDSKSENIEKGRSYNMIEQADGSIRDVALDFPEAIIHATAQAIAHRDRDGRIPEGLKDEIGDLLLGNLTKSSAKLFSTISKISTGDIGPAEFAGVAMDNVIKTATGSTRPLDPLNSAVKFIRKDFTEVDKNTSGDAWTDFSYVKKATRYTDQFFKVLGLGPETSPKATMGIPTYGSSNAIPQLTLGTRQAGGLPLSRKMLNTIGKADWDTFNWGGDKELRNYMNTRMESIFQAHSEALYESRPNFFELPLRTQEMLVTEMVSSSKKTLQSIFETYGGDEMKYRSRYKKVNKTNLKDTMRDLDIKGDLFDLLDEEEGLAKIDVILTLAEQAKDIFMK